MKTSKSFLFAVLTLMLFSACEKKAWELKDKEEERLAGTYTVNHYRETVYDAQGKQISATDHPDYGTITFKMKTDKGSDVFSHCIFGGDAAGTFVPHQLTKASDCGTWVAATQEFWVHYQCDVNQKRLRFGAICRGITLVYDVDYNLKGNALSFATRAVDKTTQQQMLYEYTLTRQ